MADEGKKWELEKQDDGTFALVGLTQRDVNTLTFMLMVGINWSSSSVKMKKTVPHTEAINFGAAWNRLHSALAKKRTKFWETKAEFDADQAGETAAQKVKCYWCAGEFESSLGHKDDDGDWCCAEHSEDCGVCKRAAGADKVMCAYCREKFDADNCHKDQDGDWCCGCDDTNTCQVCHPPEDEGEPDKELCAHCHHTDLEHRDQDGDDCCGRHDDECRTCAKEAGGAGEADDDEEADEIAEPDLDVVPGR